MARSQTDQLVTDLIVRTAAMEKAFAKAQGVSARGYGQITAGSARMAKQVERDFARTSRSIEQFSGVASGLRGVFAAVLGGAAAGAAVGIIRNMEKLRASLETVTGSAAGAAQAFDMITKLAATTPFSVEQVTQAFIKLKALGLDPSEAAIISYGNTAAAMSKGLDQMIEAVADAATGEFERLKEFGIRASSQGDRVAFTFRGITTVVGKNAAEIEAYLKGIGDVQFAGAMERQARTLDGALSNLSDSSAALIDRIGQAGLGRAIADLAREMSDTAQDGEGLATFLGETLGGAVDSLTERLRLLNGVVEDFRSGGFVEGLNSLGKSVLDADPLLNYLIKNFGEDYQSARRKIIDDGRQMTPAQVEEWNNAVRPGVVPGAANDVLEDITVRSTSSGGGAAPIATARELVGLREDRDRDLLKTLFAQSGQNVDPKMTAWCAAFVNAVLATNGLPGTSALNARSFLDYGEATEKPEIGDLVVLKRGNDQRKGHVGFFEGYDADGNVRVLGGNTDDKVGVASFNPGEVLGYRRIPGAEAGKSTVLDDVQSQIKSRDAAAEAAQKQAEAIKDVTNQLRFEGEQLGRTTLQQEIAVQLRQAGVDAASAEGQAIAALVTRNYELQQAQEATKASQEALAARAGEFADLAKGAVGGLISDLRNGVSAADAMANALDRVAERLIDMALDSLFTPKLFAGLLGGLGGGAGAPLNLIPRANGGPVRKGGAYWVGERGPEPFIPNTSGTIIPNARAVPPAGRGNGGGDVVLNITNTTGEPVEKTGERMTDIGRMIDLRVGESLMKGRYDKPMRGRYALDQLTTRRGK